MDNRKNKDSKPMMNKIPPAVEFERTKKSFLNLAALGYVGDTAVDTAYFYKKLCGFLSLEDAKMIGDLWRDTYTDPKSLEKLENYVISTRYYR